MTTTDIWLIGAAVVQAVGSVLAILVAVAINDAGTKRLEADRKRERDDEKSAQIGTLGQAIIVLTEAANGVRLIDCANLGRLDPRHGQALEAAKRAIGHHLNQGRVNDTGVLIALTLAEQLVGEANADINRLGVPLQTAANNTMLKLNGYVEAIAKVIDQNMLIVPG